MKIKFTGKYKSITTFESEDLSNLTIITGKNGTGKTQLLAAIEQVFNQPSNYNNNKTFSLTIEPNPSKVQIGNLIYKNISISYTSIANKLEQYFNRLTSLAPNIKEFYTLLYNNDISIRTFKTLSPDNVQTLMSPKDLKQHVLNILQQNGFSGIGHLSESELLLKLYILIDKDADLLDVLIMIKKFKAKEFNQIDKNDFYLTPIPEKYVDTSDLFASQVEMIVHNYLQRRTKNDYQNFRKERYAEENKAIDDAEFEKMHPTPWNIINTILKEHNVGLQIQEFRLQDYSEQMVTEVRYFKTGVNEPVSLNDLSSGEQVIISLILKLFTKDYYKGDLRFPDIIVLDEPDAYLHPEMSKLLIDVLYKSFVQDLGVKVIITTHSPSTVALSPDGCIYEMRNSPNCSLKKISKDEALDILTGVLPTLSIDYKNHKQIFLESPTDVNYFQNVFNKVNSEEKLNYKLYFISNEKGKSNCEWVKEIVSKLKEGGISKVFGIIDWDGKNSSSTDIFVHGEGSRYSIENFLYDAIYLAILFLEANGANNIRSELNFSETFVQYNLPTENNGRLQIIWNWVIGKICKEFPAYSTNNNAQVNYYNGTILNIPDWYLNMKGHELEQKLRKAFPSLSKYQDEGKLQKDLSIIMAKCYPFIPSESVNIIKLLAI